MSFLNAKIVCKNADPLEYHASTIPRGDKAFVVSSSMLRLFAQCASRWKFGYESPDSDAKKFGSLLDCRLLTPTMFDKKFAIKPATYTSEKGEEKPFNLNSNSCKAWVEEQGDKEIISASDVAEIDTARDRILKDEILAAWFESCDKQVWLAGEWLDEKTKLKFPIKALLDCVPRIGTEFEKCLGDAKAVRSAALIPFQRQVFQLGWHVQAAFYQDFYVAATKEDRNSYCFVGVENYKPFEPFRRLLAQEFVHIGRLTYQHALKRYAACLASGTWPSYDDHADSIGGWSLINPEPWQEFSSMSDAIESQQAEELETPLDITP
jgi:hypothetical protein